MKMSFASLYATVVLVLYYIGGNNADECITYNFEDGFESAFPNSAMCEMFESNWYLALYKETAIEPPDERSVAFIKPSTYYSCASSIPLQLNSGRLEVNIYNEGQNSLSVMVQNASNSRVLGSRVVNTEEIFGWEKVFLDIDLPSETYAKVIFVGTRNYDTTILVDSLRFIPESLIGIHEYEESCDIYNDNNFEPPPTTETDINYTTETILTEPTEESLFDQECVTFNFEEDFDVVFPNTASICQPYVSWNLAKFTSISPPHVDSTKFISPNDSLSCISTIPIKIRSGVLELNTFVEGNNISDITLTIAIAEYPYGSNILSTQHVHFEDNGWQKINMAFNGRGYESGMIVLLGDTRDNSLLIDSIRFIPTELIEIPEAYLPDSCVLYPSLESTTDLTTNNPTNTFSTTTDSTTNDPTTTFSTTTDSTTNDPTTVVSTTTDSTTNAPTTNDPTTTFFTTTDSTTNDFTTTDPTTTVFPTTEYSTTSDQGITDTEPDYIVTDSTTNDEYIYTTTEEETSRTESSTDTYSTTDSGVPDPSTECVTYNFEDNFDYKFTNDIPLCAGIPATWNWKSYYNFTVDPPNFLSTRFMKPTSGQPSCIASFPFKLTSGLLEVNVYLQSTDAVLSILLVNAVNNFETVGGDVFQGLYGWNTVNVSINIDRIMPSYVVFIGNKFESAIMIDSFRFIPEHLSSDDQSCQIYSEPYTTTEYSTTNVPEIDECIVYNFENNNSSAFSSDGFLCSLLPGEWATGFYSDALITPPHPKSNNFKFSPPFIPSCMSSIPFRLSTGTIEFNIFSKFYEGDGFAVFVWEYIRDIGLGSAMVQSVNGWNTVSVNIVTDAPVTAYINIVGYTNENSTLLIDSMRFIPINLPDTDESCLIYPKTPECITFDLEEDFYSRFRSGVPMCSPMPGLWSWESYSDGNIDQPRNESTRFITPLPEKTSCIATTSFVIGNGTITVNFYTETLPTDAFTILVVDASDDSSIVAGKFILPNYGWQTVSINVLTEEIINGYVVLVGHRGSTSTIIVDSFKFVPEDSDIYDDACILY